MLTLHKADENVYVCDLVEGKKRTPVYWHPKINAEMRNSVTDLNFFNDDYFRDRFELSRDQAVDIFDKLGRGETLESNQSKFFKVKRHVTEALETEMNLDGTDGKFEIPFPPGNDTFEGHTLVCGGTNSGKTYWCSARILQNLKGPKKDRRQFIIFSAEYNRDKTLAPLKHEKYREWVHGVDCSETSVRDSQWQNKDEFFANEVEFVVNSAPPSVILFDDATDCAFPQLMRNLIVRLLRVGRHQSINVMVILHSIRSASWSTQAHQSCKYLVLFPRSQKGKITQYINRDLGVPLGKARDHVRAFGQTGRTMVVRLHAPELLLGEQLIRLL